MPDRRDAALRTRARAAGLIDRYVDGLGVRRVTSIGALEALLASLDPPTDAVPRMVVARAGMRRLSIGVRADSARLDLEDGGGISAACGAGGQIQVHSPLPIGTHRLLARIGRRDRTIHVLAAPRTLAPAVEALGRRLAVFVPLYSVRPAGGVGVGSLTDLGTLVDWARELGASFVGTLPLFPTFLDRPFDPSPYAPVSRLMWNELFADPFRGPESSAAKMIASSAVFRAAAAAARRGRHVDYRESWRLTREVLSACARAARLSEARWAQIEAHAGPDAHAYAAFRAAADATGTGFHAWPEAWRRGRIDRKSLEPGVVDTFIYAQALLNEQMHALARLGHGTSPLYLDLPVGVHADGFDVWRSPRLFVTGVSAGAPPDALYAAGQVWGFPPMHPTAGRDDGYSHLRAILRRMLAVAGVLRIDHVMGLHRIYCVPPGFDGSQGAYLRFPAEELFAVLMIEAARAGAVVVGEDLGTVPPVVRRMMASRGLLGMHVQQFALHDAAKAIEPSGRRALASLNTHDTPTFAGFWSGDDLGLARRLGIMDRDTSHAQSTARARVRRAVRRELAKKRLPCGSARAVALSLMRLQARGAAPITLINLEDVWGEREPQNVPGTSTEHANWTRRTSLPLRAIRRDTTVRRALTTLAEERASPRRSGRV